MLHSSDNLDLGPDMAAFTTDPEHDTAGLPQGGLLQGMASTDNLDHSTHFLYNPDEGNPIHPIHPMPHQHHDHEEDEFRALHHLQHHNLQNHQIHQNEHNQPKHSSNMFVGGESSITGPSTALHRFLNMGDGDDDDDNQDAHGDGHLLIDPANANANPVHDSSESDSDSDSDLDDVLDEDDLDDDDDDDEFDDPLHDFGFSVSEQVDRNNNAPWTFDSTDAGLHITPTTSSADNAHHPATGASLANVSRNEMLRLKTSVLDTVVLQQQKRILELEGKLDKAQRQVNRWRTLIRDSNSNMANNSSTITPRSSMANLAAMANPHDTNAHIAISTATIPAPPNYTGATGAVVKLKRPASADTEVFAVPTKKRMIASTAKVPIAPYSTKATNLAPHSPFLDDGLDNECKNNVISACCETPVVTPQLVDPVSGERTTALNFSVSVGQSAMSSSPLVSTPRIGNTMPPRMMNGTLAARPGAQSPSGIPASIAKTVVSKAAAHISKAAAAAAAVNEKRSAPNTPLVMQRLGSSSTPASLKKGGKPIASPTLSALSLAVAKKKGKAVFASTTKSVKSGSTSSHPDKASMASAGDSATGSGSGSKLYNSESNESLDRQEGSTRYWTKAEHERFLLGVSKFGAKNYTMIAGVVRTRNPQQVRTHAQKFEMRLDREARRKAELDPAKVLKLDTKKELERVAQRAIEAGQIKEKARFPQEQQAAIPSKAAAKPVVTMTHVQKPTTTTASSSSLPTPAAPVFKQEGVAIAPKVEPMVLDSLASTGTGSNPGSTAKPLEPQVIGAASSNGAVAEGGLALQEKTKPSSKAIAPAIPAPFDAASGPINSLKPPTNQASNSTAPTTASGVGSVLEPGGNPQDALSKGVDKEHGLPILGNPKPVQSKPSASVSTDLKVVERQGHTKESVEETAKAVVSQGSAGKAEKADSESGESDASDSDDSSDSNDSSSSSVEEKTASKPAPSAEAEALVNAPTPTPTIVVETERLISKRGLASQEVAPMKVESPVNESTPKPAGKQEHVAVEPLASNLPEQNEESSSGDERKEGEDGGNSSSSSDSDDSSSSDDETTGDHDKGKNN